MEAGAALLLLSALLGVASPADFYGESLVFMPPQRRRDGTFKVTFHHSQNGRGDCQDQSSFTCENSVCISFNKSKALVTDQDATKQNRWCQIEGHTTAVVLKNNTKFSLRASGCCWLPNISGNKKWSSLADVNLGTRSDTRTLNRCPVTTTVSSLRVPQNCFTKLELVAHDPDGDRVTCTFAADSKFTLNEATCTLTSKGQLDVGVHVIEILLQDFPRTDINLTHSDRILETLKAGDSKSTLCQVKVQFSVEILHPIPNCVAGHVQPMFLLATPSHGDVLFATVGQVFQLNAEARAQHASIQDFQVSGPQNMMKSFTNEANGKAKLTLKWVPHLSDLYRFVPVCFTAETPESQSDMRCVTVTVTQSTITEGRATVECSANKMMVALEKASMPGIDVNYLKLRDKSCSLTSNDTHIMGSMSFHSCGTELEDKGDFIVFNNEINSYELPSEIIVRRKTVRINFSCQFPKSISISTYYNLRKSDFIFTEASFGSFGYSFEIYLDSSFSKKVEASAYPVEVKLMDSIFMGIRAESELPNVELFVESCKGTPDDNPENSLSYDLIKDGCVQDETLKVHPSNKTTFNFEVQSFKFTGNYDQVYITCAVILCDPDSPFSRCAQGCVKTPSRRRRRALGTETNSHFIIQGPVKLVGPTLPVDSEENSNFNAVMEKDGTYGQDPTTVIPPTTDSFVSDLRSSEGVWVVEKTLSPNMSTLIFATLFLCTLVSLALVVRRFTRKRKAEDCKSLINSEI